MADTTQNWDKRLLHGFWREDNGTPSMSRMGTTLALGAAIFWVTISLFMHKEIPNLTGPAEWVTSTTLCMYGVNAASRTVQALKTPSCDSDKN